MRERERERERERADRQIYSETDLVRQIYRQRYR